MIRVLLVDSNPVFRECLSAALVADPDIHVVAGLGTAEAGIDLALRARPTVAVIDVRLPGMNGYDACMRLQRNPRTAVVLAMSTPTRLAVRRGVSAGCGGVIGKAAQPGTFREAVRAVAERSSFIDPALRHLAARPNSAPLEIDVRDRQLVNLLAAGLNNSEIAERLGDTQAMVKARVSRLVQTMGARWRADLSALASPLEVVDPQAGVPTIDLAGRETSGPVAFTTPDGPNDVPADAAEALLDWLSDGSQPPATIPPPAKNTTG